jgi:tripartite ATP-independent transporter DctP family solute receptor
MMKVPPPTSTAPDCSDREQTSQTSPARSPARRRFLAAAVCVSVAPWSAVSRAEAGASSVAPKAGNTASNLFTAADVHVDGYPTVEAVRWMGETLARETGGQLGIRVYHSGQLGREGDAVNLARFGALDIARVNVAALNNAFPLTDVLALPYVFDSAEHMHRALDGATGREILRGFEARGLVGLAFYDSGVRCFYNHRRPIVLPADLKGLKIRVPPSDIFVSLVRALGANPTPLSYGEVFSALQTRLIDGAENNWTTFFTSRQFEVARHWSQSLHSFAPEVLLMSKRTLGALSPAHRALVLDVAAQSVPYMRERWVKRESESREAVERAGVQIAQVDRRAFQQAVAPLMQSYLRDSVLQRLYRQIRALA